MCTTVIVGKSASKRGSTLIARNCDAEVPIEPIKMVNVPENAKQSDYRSNITGLHEELPAQSYRYNMVPFVDAQKNGLFGEAGINSQNVAMSSTESIFSNPDILSIDPLVDKGLGEDSLLNTILPYIKSARGGVSYLGAVIEQYGSHEGNGIIFSDKDEIWYMEIPCGHHWVAQRIPDDCCAVIANQSIIQEIDFEDKDNFMYSAGLKEFVEKYDLNPDYEGFNFRHIFGTSTAQDRRYNTSRVWYGQNYFGLKSDDPTSDDMPFVFKPNRKLSYEDVAYVLSSHYNETEYDPFDDNNPITKKKFRPISMNRTAESHILEIRNDVPQAYAGIFWLNTSPTAFNAYVPFYANSTDSSPRYNNTALTFDINQAYWATRTLSVLVERDYDKLLTLNIAYLVNARTLANRLILETDKEAGTVAVEKLQDFLTNKNAENADKMYLLAMEQIGDLMCGGFDLSRLTFDITKDV